MLKRRMASVSAVYPEGQGRAVQHAVQRHISRHPNRGRIQAVHCSSGRRMHSQNTLHAQNPKTLTDASSRQVGPLCGPSPGCGCRGWRHADDRRLGGRRRQQGVCSGSGRGRCRQGGGGCEVGCSGYSQSASQACEVGCKAGYAASIGIWRQLACSTAVTAQREPATLFDLLPFEYCLVLYVRRR